eukprot:TRINITY_DN28_c0_g1_i1.p1 TRINITY_DN28_c0_g1~~TRINITY_DN28_c0_g1_i1.p1  ORF type:complete len:732 (+),score=160.24 TRINITY_DN28_c0_g1_i1:87-2282(+)
MAQTIDRKLIYAVFGLAATVLLIFRRELLPFFFHESPLKEFEFRRPPPTIDALTKAHGVAPTSGKTAILVEGTNFGDDVSVIHVSIGVSYCTNIQLVSDTKLTCTIPPGVGKDLAVIVVVNGLASSKPLYFSYDAPSIQQISASHGPTEGRQSLTITGLNFGPEDTWVTGYVGEYRSPNTRWISANAVELLTPKGVGKGLVVSVVVGDQRSAERVLYNYDAPTIESITPSNGPTTGGASVIVKGSNFGPRYSMPVVSVGGKNCVFTTWRDDSKLECSLPDGVGTNKQVVVNVGGQASTEKIIFSYDAPTISSIHPISGPPAGKTPITIMGTNFGHMGDSSVKFSSGACAIKSATDAEIVCETPAGKEGQTNVIVTVGGQTNNPPAVWFYGVSKITSIEPTHGKITGGYPLTIKGAMLGASEADITDITIGDRSCRNIEWKSSSEIVCTVPAGSGKAKVVVQIGDQAIETTFTYDVTEIKVTSAIFTDIDTLEVRGSGLDKDVDINFPYAKCFVNEDLSDFEKGVVVCEVREDKLSDMARDLSIVVSLRDITSPRFEIEKWDVKDPLPSKGTTDKVTSIAVPISNFPAVSRDKWDFLSVELNGKVADITSSEKGKLFIHLRPAQSSIVEVEILLGNKKIGKTVFAYEVPKITKTTFADGKITLEGSNFGELDPNAKFTFEHSNSTDTSDLPKCLTVRVDHHKIDCFVAGTLESSKVKVSVDILGTVLPLTFA